MVEIAEYLRLRDRPAGPPAMYQNWRDLLFLHFAVEPPAVQALLPPGLTVDTFPGPRGHEMAWIGFVPFRMEGIRLRGFPGVPTVSAFPETNVRTYVHTDGKDPGVWFFSLDAASVLACRVARRFYALPYHKARMNTTRSGNRIEYASLRSTRSDRRSRAAVVCEVGAPLPLPEPGSLEFFLTERYLLYSRRGDRQFTGRVFHEPYSLRSANLVSCETSLLSACGLPPHQSWDHVRFSEGVDVEVFGLRAHGASRT